MIIGIMQPYFFPYIGYWQLIRSVDKYVILDDVNYIKGGWINRNKILMNNEAKMLSISLERSSPNKLINEIEVSKSDLNKRKILTTIEQSYGRAPFFERVFPIIQRVVTQEEANLAKYLEFSIRLTCDYLSIETEIIVSSSLTKNNNLKGQSRVIEICKLLGAREYINAIGGKALYSYDDFLKNRIALKFLETDEMSYPQFQGDFVPNLSVIDIMMFNSIEKIRDFLTNCRFV